jgi:hypothetical protein
MSTLSDPFGSVKDTAAERDLLLHGLRLAATRSRLKTTIFEAVHVALRQKSISCSSAIKRLKSEGVLAEVEIGGSA